MPMDNVSFELKLSLPCQLLGGILFLISFSEPHWWEESSGPATSYEGLWKACGYDELLPDTEICIAYTGHNQPAWLLAVEILECLALVSMLLAFLLTVRLLLGQQRSLFIVAALTASTSGLLGLVGAITFAVEESKGDGKLGWAFYLHVTSDILIGAASGPLLVHAARLTSAGYASYTRMS